MTSERLQCERQELLSDDVWDERSTLHMSDES